MWAAGLDAWARIARPADEALMPATIGAAFRWYSMKYFLAIVALFITLGASINPGYGSTCGGPSCLSWHPPDAQAPEHVKFEGQLPG